MVTLAKEKKISFNYFLNKRLKSRVYPDGLERFLPYVRINFNSNNHQCAFGLIYGDGTLTEDEFYRFFIERENPIINKEIEEFEERIIETIRIEFNLLSDKFKYRGLSQRSFNYYGPFLQKVEDCIKSEFTEYLMPMVSNETIDLIVDTPDDIGFTYKVVKDTKQGGLINEIPESLRYLLIAYSHLIIFDQWDKVEKRQSDIVRIIDWFTGDLKDKFKNFLMLDAGKGNYEKRLSLYKINTENRLLISFDCLLQDVDYEFVEIGKILKNVSLYLVR